MRKSQEIDTIQDAMKATVAIGSINNLSSQHSRMPYFDGETTEFNVEATGFIYSFTPFEFAENKSEPDPETGFVYYWSAIWIVTCKHCISDSFVAVRLNTMNGGSRVFLVDPEKWILHPTEDVAVTPLSLTANTVESTKQEVDSAICDVDFVTISDKSTANRTQIARTGFIESTPISMIGFPVGMIEGGKRNYPVVRSGAISQIQGYLDGESGHTVFLVDGSGFPGNSGGPVVVPKGTWNFENPSRLSSTVLIGMVSAASQHLVNGNMTESVDLVHVVTVDSINETIRRHYTRGRSHHSKSKME